MSFKLSFEKLSLPGTVNFLTDTKDAKAAFLLFASFEVNYSGQIGLRGLVCFCLIGTLAKTAKM